MKGAAHLGGRDLILILAGSTVLGMGIAWFASPQGLVTGGVSGLAIIAQEISGRLTGFSLPLWVSNLAFNLPLFLIGTRQRGLRFAEKSILAVLWLSVVLWACEQIANPFDVQGDLFLTCVFCGLFDGVGIGLVLRAGGTTGGTDLLAAILRFRHRGLPISQLILLIDGLIVCGGVFIFGAVRAMYAVVTIFIASRVLSTIVEGAATARAVFIFSDRAQEISRQIFDFLDRGNTGIPAQGMYTGREQTMLFAVVSRRQTETLRRLVKETDPGAFLVITDARETLGEGFGEYNPAAL